MEADTMETEINQFMIYLHNIKKMCYHKKTTPYLVVGALLS